MFDYHRTLPTLEQSMKSVMCTRKEKTIKHKFQNNYHNLSAVSHCSSTSSTEDNPENKNCILLVNLPPVVSNSTLVRQRASAKDTLAAATVSTGASLPLMIGGRSKCVVNIVEGGSDSGENISMANNRSLPSSGPQNAALRAEQRKQNMVSIVRPVMNTASGESGHTNFEMVKEQYEDYSSIHHNTSILEEFMNIETRARRSQPSSSDLDELLNATRLNNVSHNYTNEHQTRQNAILLRREESELSRGIKRQHRLVAAKIDERKRNLQIVHSVWVQKDFKHAIEKLVDLYHQGLIFASDNEADSITGKKQTRLNSLNTSLVVDIISVIILKPNLWNLEICQLLLPIIVNDLLVQTASKYENYVEIAMKSLKLILNHFSVVIKTTLESQKDSAKFTGVDLSREDRVSKCWNCYGLLTEAAGIVSIQAKSGANSNKVTFLHRELLQLFSAFQTSLEPSIVDLARRRQRNSN